MNQESNNMNNIEFDGLWMEDNSNSNVCEMDFLKSTPPKKIEKEQSKKMTRGNTKKIPRGKMRTKCAPGPVSPPTLDDISEEEVVVGSNTFKIEYAMVSDCDDHYGFQKIADASVSLNGKDVENYWVDYGPNSGHGSFYRGRTCVAEGTLVRMDVKGEDLEKELFCSSYTYHKPKNEKDK